MNVVKVVTHRIKWYHIVGLVLLAAVVAVAVWFVLERRRTASLREVDETDLVEDAA